MVKRHYHTNRAFLSVLCMKIENVFLPSFPICKYWLNDKEFLFPGTLLWLYLEYNHLSNFPALGKCKPWLPDYPTPFLDMTCDGKIYSRFSESWKRYKAYIYCLPSLLLIPFKHLSDFFFFTSRNLYLVAIAPTTVVLFWDVGMHSGGDLLLGTQGYLVGMIYL